MHIVPLYAGLLTLLFVTLSVRTLLMRRRLRIAVGHGRDETMLRAMRVHANFAEYVPLGLLLLYFVELTGASAALVHGLGGCLVAGRLAHAYGVSQTRENYAFRVFGMSMTLIPLVFAALRLLYVFATRGAT